MIFRSVFKSFRIPVAVMLMVAVPASSGQSQDRSINIVVGDFKAVSVDNDITRVSVDKPQIADYTVTSKREILVNGNRVGRTALIIWTSSGQITCSVDVTESRKARSDTPVKTIGPLIAKIQKILDNPDVVVSQTDRGVLISGHVATDAEKDKAEKVVRAFMSTTQEDVTSVLEIRKKPQQVKLKVRVMDIDETISKTYGIDWGTFQYSGVTQVVSPGSQWHNENVLSGSRVSSSFPRVVAPFYKSRAMAAIDPFMAQIRYLIDSGVIRLLSSPEIVAQAGAKTDIVIGGQIPVPSASSSGGTTQTSIEWRDYGIKMSLEPNIVDVNRVTAKIHIEVSSLDNANAITISGSRIPAMKITQATSEINVEAGKTVFLSGLKQEQTSRNVTGIPGLSELPGIGVLFGTHTRGVVRSDLVISVTAEIIDDGAVK